MRLKFVPGRIVVPQETRGFPEHPLLSAVNCSLIRDAKLTQVRMDQHTIELRLESGNMVAFHFQGFDTAHGQVPIVGMEIQQGEATTPIWTVKKMVEADPRSSKRILEPEHIMEAQFEPVTLVEVQNNPRRGSLWRQTLDELGARNNFVVLGSDRSVDPNFRITAFDADLSSVTISMNERSITVGTPVSGGAPISIEDVFAPQGPRKEIWELGPRRLE